MKKLFYLIYVQISFAETDPYVKNIQQYHQ